MSDDTPTVQLSGQRLKAIAHPLRMRMLSLLREEGPSTASRLAERIGQSSGVTSYHLRQLAEHGFVAEDETLGTGRDRWWKAAVYQMSLGSPDARESAETTEAYLRAVAIQDTGRIDRFLNEVSMLPEEWDDGVDLSSYILRLTAAEARGLVARLRAIMPDMRADQPGVDAPDGAEQVVLQVQVMPMIRRTEDAS